MKQTCFRISLVLTLLTLTGLVAARPHGAQGTLLWQQNLNGTANGFDEAFSVAVDNQGNVVDKRSPNLNFRTTFRSKFHRFCPRNTPPRLVVSRLIWTGRNEL